MAIIYSYPQIDELATGDTIAISDASNGNKTKSVTIGQLSEYFNANPVTSELYEKTVILDYDNLETLNGGNAIMTYSDFGVTPTSALSIIDVTAYLEAGTVPFDATDDLLIGYSYPSLVGSGLDFNPKTVFDNLSLINSSSSLYSDRGKYDTFFSFLTPTPLGANFAIKFEGTGSVTQGNGTLKLKVLYRLLDFS